MSTFENFAAGKLYLLPSPTNEAFRVTDLASAAWSPHATFEGVDLKHLITAKDTDGALSYLLVRIAPYKKIGLHRHDKQLETHEVVAGNGLCMAAGQKICYEAGVLSVLPAGLDHEVTAGSKGLCLFAKFLPAL
ncbi:MAG: cupin domain-containing protein [Peptococcaceae bacterium]|nr:cupin domain-containing protein [Peptococcaceae bacterium]